MMTPLPHDDTIAFSARVLGALFYHSPDEPALAPLVGAFCDSSWTQQWPEDIPCSSGLSAQFQASSDEPLSEAWQRLFIGPYALPAPPWGSVWLDRESVLFGDSTLALRQWLRTSEIAFETAQSEPEDHFGLLLLLSAWLKENRQEERWQELMAWHLLPWAGRFLQCFIEGANHPFYRALGQLAQESIEAWKQRLHYPVAVKQLYR